jgi:nucleoside-diphosphate-sugar epimerase
VKSDTLRVLVTGANGFLGSHLVDLLALSGAYEIRALVRKTSELRFLSGKPVELVYGDVTRDPGDLDAALDGVELVFHLAGLTKALARKSFDLVNRGGTENLIQACLRMKRPPSRLVLLSSAGAMGPSLGKQALSEDMNPRPITAYGRSKLAAEHVAREYMDRLSITILRPGGIYGPRDTEFLPVFKSVERGFLVRLGLSPGRICLSHATDVARAALLAGILPEAASQTFLVGGCNISQVELGSVLAKVLGKRRLIPLVIPGPVLRTAGAISSALGMVTRKARIFTFDNTRRILAANWTIDGSKAGRLLGYMPKVDLEAGLSETAEWYRSQKLL